MSLHSVLGRSASRTIQRLQLNVRLGSETMQGSCRAYRTTPRAAYQGTTRSAKGQRTTLSQFITSSSRTTIQNPSASTARSFGSTSKQFTLPNGQSGPIPNSTRLSNPSSLLQRALNVFRLRQKPNIGTRTRTSQSRKQPNFRQRFSTSRSSRKPEGNAKSDSNDQSLGARMRRLSREYGWSALGVYLLLSALDFPFCYLLVRYLGTDRIGEWEEFLVSYIKAAIPESVKSTWHEWRSSMKKAENDVTGRGDVNEAAEMAGWGVEEAEKANNKRDASLATQLALAYAIHKSFIFIRVPITAAITPRVVKILRGWGWDIGKKTSKAAKAAKRAEVAQMRAARKAKKAEGKSK